MGVYEGLKYCEIQLGNYPMGFVVKYVTAVSNCKKNQFLLF